MKPTIIILVLLFLFQSCDRNKNENHAFIDQKQEELLFVLSNDSLSGDYKIQYIIDTENEINKIKNDSVRLQNLFKIANRYHYVNDFESYYDVSQKILREAIKIKDTQRIARSLFYIGDYFYEFNVNDSAFYYYNQSEKLYHNQLNYDVINIKLKKAHIYSFIQDYGNSEKLLIEALQAANRIKDNELIYSSYNYLGMILTKTGQYDDAIDYLERGLKVIPKIEGREHYYKTYKAQTYNNIGTAYEYNKNYKKAIVEYNKGLAQDVSTLYPVLHYSLENNLAYAKFKLGDKSVEPTLMKNLKDNDSIGYTAGAIISNVRIAEYYLQQKDSVNSQKHALEANKLANEINDYTFQLETLLLLSSVNKKREGSFLRQYIQLNDSITHEERKEREKFARIAFETDEISKEKELAVAQTEKISIRFWALLSISVLMFVIASLWFKNNQHLSKNKELQFEQDQQKIKQELYEMMLLQHQKIEYGKQAEKKRISQDLHDGVMGRLSGIRLNLFALKMDPNKETIIKSLPYIEAIQDVEKEIRAISHNLNSIAFNSSNGFDTMITELLLPAQDQGIIVETTIDEEIRWNSLSTSDKIEIYRIIQEAIQNISKHAKAKKIRLKILQLEKQILIELQDDGIGFKTGRKANGIGLTNMNSRAIRIKSTLQIDSQQDIGTKISLRIPV